MAPAKELSQYNQVAGEKQLRVEGDGIVVKYGRILDGVGAYLPGQTLIDFVHGAPTGEGPCI